jgi:O-antigen/teichoic acid export membrane protein
MLQRLKKKLKNPDTRLALSFSALHYLQSALSLVVSVFLARILGKEGYGHYVYGFLFFNILSTVIHYGQDKTLVRDLVHRGAPNSTFWAGTRVMLIMCLLTFVGILIWVFVKEHDADTRLVVVIFTLAGFLGGLSPLAWFDYHKQMNRQSLIAVGERVVFFILVVGICYWMFGVTSALLAAGSYLIARIIASLFEWYYVRRTIGQPEEPIQPLVRAIFRDNTWVFLAVLGNLMMTQFNQLILKERTSVSELALYGVSLQIVQVIRLLQRQLLRLNLRGIAESTFALTGRRLLKSLLRRTITSFGATLLLVLPLLLFSKSVLLLLFGASFVEAAPTLRVLLVWISIYGVGLIVNQYLLGLNLQRVFFINTLFFGILAVALSVYWAPEYGSLGTAWALLLSHSGSILTQTLMITRKSLSHEKIS